MEYIEFTFKIFLSLLLGLLIGLEREFTGHRVGIRINVLICLGTCFFTELPVLYGSDQVFRVGASIVSGVGFLCSAVIFKEKASVRGINTAATIWCTAAIGVLVSAVSFYYSIIATAILIGSNLILRPLAKKITPVLESDDGLSYQISITCTDQSLWQIRNMLANSINIKGLYLNNIESSDVIGNKAEVKATYLAVGKPKTHMIESITASALHTVGVISAGWEVL